MRMRHLTQQEQNKQYQIYMLTRSGQLKTNMQSTAHIEMQLDAQINLRPTHKTYNCIEHVTLMPSLSIILKKKAHTTRHRSWVVSSTSPTSSSLQSWPPPRISRLPHSLQEIANIMSLKKKNKELCCLQGKEM